MHKEYTVSEKLCVLGCNLLSFYLWYFCSYEKCSWLFDSHIYIVDAAFSHALLNFLNFSSPSFSFLFLSFCPLISSEWCQQTHIAKLCCINNVWYVQIKVHHRKNKSDTDCIRSAEFGSAGTGRFVLQKF